MSLNCVYSVEIAMSPEASLRQHGYQSCWHQVQIFVTGCHHLFILLDAILVHTRSVTDYITQYWLIDDGLIAKPLRGVKSARNFPSPTLYQVVFWWADWSLEYSWVQIPFMNVVFYHSWTDCIFSGCILVVSKKEEERGEQ